MIKTEATAGDTIKETSEQMQELADRLGFGVTGTFNGILIYTWPGRSIDYAAKVYDSGLKDEQWVKKGAKQKPTEPQGASEGERA